MNPGGSIAGAVSIPTRHIHQVIEMVNKKDVRAAIDLLRVCVENLDKYTIGILNRFKTIFKGKLKIKTIFKKIKQSKMKKITYIFIG